MKKEKKLKIKKEKKIKKEIDDLNENITLDKAEEQQADSNEDEFTKEPKKKSKVVEKFNLYKFIFKLFACAILITFGILILVFQQQAIFAIFLVTSIVVLVSALIRIVPLIRTLKTKGAKYVSLAEIGMHILLGLYLILAAFNYIGTELNTDGEITGFAKFNEDAYPYILAFILYSRAVSYFWVTVLYKENTDKFKFWLHIILITLAVVFAGLGSKLGAREIAIALAVIALVCAIVIGGEAGTGYFRYRKAVSEPKRKEKTKKTKPEIEAPAKDDEVNISDIDPNIIPINDNDRDSGIVS